MAKFKAKPMLVEAEQLIRGNPLPFEKDGAEYTGSILADNAKIRYGASELSIGEGDYVVQRQDGTYYPVVKDTFEAFYEPEG